ncbi:PilN domain-containing protein [Noviherbaspirillum humi]|nr:PilN domain-containing protein [Noviherbaspirillum humi]
MAQALLAIGAGMAALGGYSLYRSSQIQKEAGIVESRARKLQEQLIKVAESSKPIAADKNLEADAAGMQALLEAKSRILDFIKNGRPEDSHSHTEYLTALSRSALPDVWLTHFALRSLGRDIEIQGRAMRPELVASYVKALSRDEVFNGKSFGNMAIRNSVQNAAADAVPGGKPPTPAHFIEFVLNTSEAAQAGTGANGEVTR